MKDDILFNAGLQLVMTFLGIQSGFMTIIPSLPNFPAFKIEKNKIYYCLDFCQIAYISSTGCK